MKNITLKDVITSVTIILVICILALAFLCSLIEDKKQAVAAENRRIIVISEEEDGLIVYDRMTNVEYWISYRGYNMGTLTLLVDAEGNPLIYKGE